MLWYSLEAPRSEEKYMDTSLLPGAMKKYSYIHIFVISPHNDRSF